MKDDILTYSTLLSQKSKMKTVIRGLDESGWAKRPAGTIRTDAKLLEREATCVFYGDTIRFQFDDDGLSGVRIATRYLPGPAKSTWDHLKRRVSEQLRRPGVPDDLCSLGIRECEWMFGQTMVRANLFEREKTSKAYLYLERQAVENGAGTASFEDLFIY